MRFRKTHSPPPLLSRRDQLRLILMIGSLGVVLAGVQIVRNPGFWERTGLFGDSSAGPEETGTDASIDFGVQFDESGPLPPGAFRSQPTEPRVEEQQVAAAEWNESDVARRDSEPPDLGDDLTVEPELLAAVRDNTLGVRSQEADAYYALLARVRDAAPEEVQEAALEQVAFRAVMIDSDEYRGKLLTIAGELRRLTEIPAAESSAGETHGVDRLYEGWMFTPDSGNNPWRIVASEIPAGLRPDDTLEPPVRVRVTGYFFKRVGYASQGGLHTAPLLLAHRIRSVPAPAAPAASTDLINYVLCAVLGVGLILGVSIWRFTRNDRAFKKRHLTRIAAAPADALEALKNVEAVDPGEMLRRLGEAEREA